MPFSQNSRGMYTTGSETGEAAIAIAANFTELGNRAPKCNYTATTAPSSSNNASSSYYPGSLWLNTLTNTMYVCVASTSGAATWQTYSTTSHTHVIADTTGLQAALDSKATAAALTTHTSDISNPHSVTKSQVGLGNCDNTSDANKPVSTAQQSAIDAVNSYADSINSALQNEINYTSTFGADISALQSGKLSLDGSTSMTGNLDMGAYAIQNVTTISKTDNSVVIDVDGMQLGDGNTAVAHWGNKSLYDTWTIGGISGAAMVGFANGQGIQDDGSGSTLVFNCGLNLNGANLSNVTEFHFATEAGLIDNLITLSMATGGDGLLMNGATLDMGNGHINNVATISNGAGMTIGDSLNTVNIEMGGGSISGLTGGISGLTSLTIQQNGGGVILYSPDGTAYLVTVSDVGALVVTAV